MSILIILIIIAFLAGIYFCANYTNKEAFADMTGKPRCPNVLIQKNSKFYLFNSKLAQVPGVNPVVFNNLEELQKKVFISFSNNSLLDSINNIIKKKNKF